MALHFGQHVEAIRNRQGITWAEIARRIEYHPNSIPVMRKREYWNTELIDKVCKALNYNLYIDKAKEMAAILDPSGKSEPMASYESENYKQKYLESERERKFLAEEVKKLEKLNAAQERIISLIDNK